MKGQFQGWDEVGKRLRHRVKQEASRADPWLNQGQRDSLEAIAERINHHGLILADEVGMGKTRIVAAVVKAVMDAGGRAAMFIPPGLGYQWNRELRDSKVFAPPMLRSLWDYLKAWEPGAEPSPWFQCNAVLVSHLFSNWRFHAAGKNWRWALLPTLYAYWRKRQGLPFPKWGKDEALKDTWVLAAAKSICEAIPGDTDHAAYRRMEEIRERCKGTNLLDGELYGAGQSLREPFERVVGLGLGTFDLIVVDEAHKSRSVDSALTRLIDTVVLHSAQARRLAMTATPVELDVNQWRQSLQRIGMEDVQLERIGPVLQEFAEATREVRQRWRGNVSCRECFKKAAVAYQEALSPFLIRRDKREDETVQLFERSSQEPYYAYRQCIEIDIDVLNLTRPWKQAVCAAESLSVAESNSWDSKTKRLRLTFANGHGLAKILDEAKSDDTLDAEQTRQDTGDNAATNNEEPAGQGQDKRRERVDWWKGRMQGVFTSAKGVLFEHPAIRATVEEIERLVQCGEKVLVFGRYTVPMRALVQLLNAREMLRSLQAGRSWPQAKIHDAESDEDSMTAAVLAAISQMQVRKSVSSLNATLGTQYNRLERMRETFRKNFIERVEAGLAGPIGALSSRAVTLFAAFKDATRNQEAATGLKAPLQLVSRAVMNLIGPDEALEASTEELARAFIDLMDAVTDKNEGDVNGDGLLDEEETHALWPLVEQRLEEEFGVNRGGFARLMYGNTSHPSRRIIQAGFNRPGSFPRVLVAQSLVGREGLNLHQACRVVILLHPEWNPGVVEQQIGRVDRVGSHWGAMLKQAVAENASGESLPRILVKPVIFRGTYDEYNWQVLMERWADLRAQLHGVVVPFDQAQGVSCDLAIIEELSRAAPTFSPGRAKPGGAGTP